MKNVFRRPSASMVVAIMALVVAATGTALAASQVSGDKLIKKNSLSGNRLRNHTVTGTQLNLAKLGKVPSASTADSATKAQSAVSAQNAGNAATLGGKSVRWVLVNASGGIVSQSGGFVVSDHTLAGNYIINAGSTVTGHAIVVSSGIAGDPAPRGTPVAGPCGAGTEAFNCSSVESDANDGNHVLVTTSSVAGSNENHSFYLLIY